MLGSYGSPCPKLGTSRRFGRTACVGSWLTAGLMFACAGDKALDRSVQLAPAGNTAPPTAAAAGTNAGQPTAGSGPSDNPMPNWTGAKALPPPAAPAPSAPAAANDDDAGIRERAALDPNVRFEWPESSTTSNAGDNCRAGTYVGEFTCVFTDTSSGLLMLELTGPVSLTFVKSMDGEFLEISNGEFNAIANLVVGARAKIKGKLDCNTLKLDAMAVDGQWAIGDPTLPLIPGGELQGQITGMLDPTTGQLMGQWTFGDPAIGSCPGTWSVSYAP